MNAKPRDPQDEPPVPPGAEHLVERLAEKIGRHARAAAVFGEAVERDGVTVIPVAKARWGFGGGLGQGRGRGKEGLEEQPVGGGEGSGGGGGAMVVPVGYIELAHGEAHFRRIVDANQIAIVAVAATAAVLAVWGLGAALSR